MNSGIYYIFCIKNNKYYIGQSIDLEMRIKAHINKLNSNTHHSKYLQNSWNKYGKENFEFKIIEFCEIEKLNNKEIEYINLYNSYNPKGFNSTIGGNGIKGMKFSQKTKDNWSKNRKGKYLGKEHPKHKSIKGIKIDTKEEIKFDSISDAERFLNKKGANKNISACCLNKKKTAYGFKWYYN